MVPSIRVRLWMEVEVIAVVALLIGYGLNINSTISWEVYASSNQQTLTLQNASFLCLYSLQLIYMGASMDVLIEGPETDYFSYCIAK
jgi:hypothetical protein